MEAFSISTKIIIEDIAGPLTPILFPLRAFQLIATSVTFHVPNGHSESSVPTTSALITEEIRT